MTDFTVVILLTLFGFLFLAALLLVPVYRFLRREEQASRRWTKNELARRSSADASVGNGRPRRGDPAEQEGADPRDDID